MANWIKSIFTRKPTQIKQQPYQTNVSQPVPRHRPIVQGKVEAMVPIGRRRLVIPGPTAVSAPMFGNKLHPDSINSKPVSVKSSDTISFEEFKKMKDPPEGIKVRAPRTGYGHGPPVVPKMYLNDPVTMSKYKNLHKSGFDFSPGFRKRVRDIFG